MKLSLGIESNPVISTQVMLGLANHGAATAFWPVCNYVQAIDSASFWNNRARARWRRIVRFARMDDNIIASTEYGALLS